MDGNLVLDADAISKMTGVSKEMIAAQLDKIKNCQMLALVHEGKLVILLPDPDSAAVTEANKLHATFTESLGKRGV